MLHCMNTASHYNNEALLLALSANIVHYSLHSMYVNVERQIVDMTIAPALQDLKGCLRPDFHWGFATAAAQVEGAVKDGKGLSIWDTFAKVPGKVKDGSDPSQAVRSYDFYKKDVQLLKCPGVTAYRFSLSWSRIIPLGGKDDAINEQGITFYSNLIDELLANNITPFVTLFHWDTPQALEDRYLGMLDCEKYTPDFLRYARLCFTRFGDRLKHWMTYNEPRVYSLAGYTGPHAPARSSDRSKNEQGDSSTEPFIVAHTEILSHAYAVKLYREEFKSVQKGEIGITLHGNWSEPFDSASPLDQAAAERAREFAIAWFADPIYKTGDYPASMREQLGDRLPTFSEAEKELVLGSSDFYGMNSYTTFFVQHRDEPAELNDNSGNIVKTTVNSEGKSRGPEAPTYWLATCPEGFRKLLSWIYERYRMPIYITEKSTTAPREEVGAPPSSEVLDDKHRIEFFNEYLEGVARAVKGDGVDVRNYLAWTFTDNWYVVQKSRFGIREIVY
jgi:beta-glucosidase